MPLVWLDELRNDQDAERVFYQALMPAICEEVSWPAKIHIGSVGQLQGHGLSEGSGPNLIP